MRAPRFWMQDQAGLWAMLLLPVSWIFGALTARRMRQRGEKLDCRVIAIGNFTAGGAGKTPTAIAVGKLCQSHGKPPAFVSRGYGGQLEGPLQVHIGTHDARAVGDEPLLLARIARTMIGRDRAAAARLASRSSKILILDDALQNPAVQKDLTIAVVDGPAGLGNGCVIPAGPLRAPLASQLGHVDAILIIGDDRQNIAAKAHSIPVLHGALQPDTATITSLRGKPLHAFAGIGRPEKFFAMLREHGLDVAKTTPFADHASFSQADIQALLASIKTGLHLVTTAKDQVRLTGSSAAIQLASLTSVVDIELQCAELESFLLGRGLF